MPVHGSDSVGVED